MQWLTRHGYSSIRPSDWLAWLSVAKSLPVKAVLITFDDAYADIAEHALPVLRRYRMIATVFAVTGKLGDRTLWNNRLMLTDSQIKYWANCGFEFGAHSRTHCNLSQQNGQTLKNEIAGSRADLQRVVEGPVTTFAYPFGSYTKVVRDAVEEVFDLAFTCQEGLNNIRTDPLLLCRTEIHARDSMFDFVGAVRYGWKPIARLRGRLRLRSRLNKFWIALRATDDSPSRPLSGPPQPPGKPD